ncbi:NUDIX domain-containing protein [Bacillus sp. JJ1122]|uniref:NUDIX hydrolase n=1 Tax=Bacillus sp. JJ1122 TaxID=3122951 RepID=UPI002FFEB5CA
MAEKSIVLVASVSILKENKVLMIKEMKPSAYNKWNFPSGRIEYMEGILDAACREVKEETGYDVSLTGTTGVYNFISSSNHQVILFHFTGEIIGGALELQEDEIIDARWITLEGILTYDSGVLRDESVIRQIANRLLKKEIYALDIFSKQLSGNGEN